MSGNKTLFEHFGLHTTQAQDMLLLVSTPIRKSKNDLISEENKPDESEYILISGVMHRYNISDEGECVTTGLYQGPCVISPHFTRTLHSKSIFSLQALTECDLLSIPVVELDRLRYAYPEFRMFGQQILEKESAANLYNGIVFRTMSARSRLQLLRKTFPNIENLIPHSVIASYLGITQVSFSRLRRDQSAG